MARWDTKRKLERNRTLKEYAKEHPELSSREIAEVFGICRSRVWRIINGNYKQKVAT